MRTLWKQKVVLLPETKLKPEENYFIIPSEIIRRRFKLNPLTLNLDLSNELNHLRVDTLDLELEVFQVWEKRQTAPAWLGERGRLDKLVDLLDKEVWPLTLM